MHSNRKVSVVAKIAVALAGASTSIAVSGFIKSHKSPPPPLPAPLPSDYSGKLVDRATGKPIAGARVLLDTEDGIREDRTDSNGEFRFRKVDKGSIRLSIEAFGYMPYDSHLPFSMEHRLPNIELEPLKPPAPPSNLVQTPPPFQPPPQHHPQRQYTESCYFTAEHLGITSLPERSEGFRVTCKGMKPGALVEISASGSIKAVNQGLNPKNASAWIIAHITGAEGQGVRQSVNPLPNDGDFPLIGTAKVSPSGEVSTSVVVEHVQTWPNEHGPLHFGPNYHIVIRSL